MFSTDSVKLIQFMQRTQLLEISNTENFIQSCTFSKLFRATAISLSLKTTTPPFLPQTAHDVTDRLEDIVLLSDDDQLEDLPRALHHAHHRRVRFPHRRLAVHVNDAIACKDKNVIRKSYLGVTMQNCRSLTPTFSRKFDEARCTYAITLTPMVIDL